MNIQAKEFTSSTANLLMMDGAPGNRAVESAIIADLNRLVEKFATASDSKDRLFKAVGKALLAEAVGRGEALDAINSLADLGTMVSPDPYDYEAVADELGSLSSCFYETASQMAEAE